MNISSIKSSNRSSEQGSALSVIPIVMMAVGVLALYVIGEIGRQVHQYDADLTEKTISFFDQLVERVNALFDRSQIKDLSPKLIGNTPSEPAIFCVEDAVNKIGDKAYALALSLMNEHQPLQSGKEAIAKEMLLGVQEISKWAFSQERPNRLKGMAENDYKKLQCNAVLRHVESYMKAFQMALELKSSCTEAKTAADLSKSLGVFGKREIGEILKKLPTLLKPEVSKFVEYCEDLEDQKSLSKFSSEDSMSTRPSLWVSPEASSPMSNRTK
ncbi:MAG: hypothetical protein V4489_00545 [Chlamydiota bacterium]